MSTTRTRERREVGLPTDVERAEAREALQIATERLCHMAWLVQTFKYYDDPDPVYEYVYEVPTLERIGAMFLFLRYAEARLSEMRSYSASISRDLDYTEVVRAALGAGDD
jgi:hypothetical protein